MESHDSVVVHSAIENLRADIVRTEETIAKLKAAGHLSRDAERYLKQLKEKLILLL